MQESNFNKVCAEVEQQIQAINEEFNKEVQSIIGSKHRKDNELCFPSFENKSRKKVEKQYKGFAG